MIYRVIKFCWDRNLICLVSCTRGSPSVSIKTLSCRIGIDRRLLQMMKRNQCHCYKNHFYENSKVSLLKSSMFYIIQSTQIFRWFIVRLLLSALHVAVTSCVCSNAPSTRRTTPSSTSVTGSEVFRCIIEMHVPRAPSSKKCPQ